MAEQKPDKKAGILSLAIRDTAVLYSAYMPFIKNGGLFVPTNKAYEIGDEISLLLSVMQEKEKYPITGKVVWKTPQGAQSNRVMGIGVQFPDTKEGANLHKKIETYLAGALKSERTFNLINNQWSGSSIRYSKFNLYRQAIFSFS